MVICTKMLLIFSIFLILFIRSLNCESLTIVTTPVGRIQGSVMVSILGNTFHAFRGIPYAEAPIGELRYKPPIPAANFSEVFDAQNEGLACHQLRSSFEASEDCLRLNVYTGQIPSEYNQYKKSVIVYIHPGGFHSLTGRSDFAGPHYLLDQDIVLVTINYRLGSFGFLTTGDREAPGNNGMKDQVLALKWVKDNIASFGGDPDNVTIFGYSAGSISVLFHLVSPMSKGLFHKAIAMSGVWNPKHNNYPYAEKQAIQAQCPTYSSKVMLSCLRQINATYIMHNYENQFEFLGDYPVITWGPVVEEDFGQERFLTDDPEKLIRETDLSNIPIMIGMSQHEFVYPAHAIMEHKSLIKEVNHDWNKLAPIIFNYERDTEKSIMVSSKLREIYLDGRDLKDDDESLCRLRTLCTDGMIGFPLHRCVDLLADSEKNHIYAYRFSYAGNYSFMNLHTFTRHNYSAGPIHNDELIYLFTIANDFKDIFTSEHKDYAIVYKMTKMWTNFAKFGNPTPEDDQKLDSVKWPQFDKHDKLYLDISDKIQAYNCLYCDRFEIWDELFPLQPLIVQTVGNHTAN